MTEAKSYIELSLPLYITKP